MRHGVKKTKLQRSTSHRRSLLSNQACDLINYGCITTTLTKAKTLRPYVEKLITKGKCGSLHARRLALAELPQPAAVKKLFSDVAEATKERQGGYTRIIKLGQRKTDSAPMAYIEIIDVPKVSRKKNKSKKNNSVTTGSATTTAEAAAAAIAAAQSPAQSGTSETPAESPTPAESVEKPSTEVVPSKQPTGTSPTEAPAPSEAANVPTPEQSADTQTEEK